MEGQIDTSGVRAQGTPGKDAERVKGPALEESPPNPKKDPSEAALDADQQLLLRFHERFGIMDNAWAQNRKNHADDVRFLYIEQWDSQDRDERTKNHVPTLTINLLLRHSHSLVNSIRQNIPGSIVSPKDDDAHKDVARILEGHLRNVNHSSNADLAMVLAAANAEHGGYGAWEIVTKYEQDDPDEAEPDAFDQEIRLKPIPHMSLLYFDPHFIMPDASDLEDYCLVSRLAKKRFEAKYGEPGERPTGDTVSAAFSQLWNEEMVPVAKWCYLDSETRTITKGKRSRTATVQTVKWIKTNGKRILERGTLPIKRVPLILTFGDLVPIDGRWHTQGQVRPQRDPQRAYNYMESGIARAIGNATMSGWTGPSESMEAFENIYAEQNRKPTPMLPYEPTVVGNTVLKPERIVPDPPPAALLAGRESAAQNIENVSGKFQPMPNGPSNRITLGQETARRNDSDLGTFQYADNLRRAKKLSDSIVLDLTPAVYDTERVLRILGEDGSTHDTVNVNTEQHPDAMPEAVWSSRDVEGKIVKNYDLRIGTYGVEVESGPDFATRRDQEAANQLELMKVNPALAPVVSYFMAGNQKWRGAEKLQTAVLAMLNMTMPQVAQALTDKESMDPQAEAAQLRAQVQQLTQAAQQMGQLIQAMKGKLDDKQRDQALKAMQIAAQEMTKRLDTLSKLQGQHITTEGHLLTESLKHHQNLMGMAYAKHLDMLSEGADQKSDQIQATEGSSARAAQSQPAQPQPADGAGPSAQSQLPAA